MSAPDWTGLFEWRRQLRTILKKDMECLNFAVDSQFVSAANMKLVGLMLSTYAGPEGRCWPSVKRLAKDSAIHERTVQKALAGLEEIGFLRLALGGGRWGNGRGRTSTYQLVLFGTYPGDAPGYEGILEYVTCTTPVLRTDTPADDPSTVALDADTPAPDATNPGAAPPEVVFEVGSEAVSESDSELVAPGGAQQEAVMNGNGWENLDLAGIDRGILSSFERHVLKAGEPAP